MKIAPEVIRYEFIGTEAKVAGSVHPDYVGLSGKIVNETRNTFIFLHEGKRKIVPKSCSVFHFRFSDRGTVEIDGSLLVGRSEDRLKKTVRRLW
jgi:ribonuclease P protein subunit POP4